MALPPVAFHLPVVLSVPMFASYGLGPVGLTGSATAIDTGQRNN